MTITKTKTKTRFLGAALIASAAMLNAQSAVAQADQTAAEFAAYLDALKATDSPAKNAYMPGVMHAVVAPHGTGYASANIFSPRGGVPGAGPDGSSAFGLGFGDAINGIGGSITMNVTGMSPFGTDGDFTLKFAKAISTGSNNATYVGVQFNRLGAWGVNKTYPESVDVSMTHFGSLGDTSYIATLGYGTQNFTGEAGFFGGVGFGLTENLGMGISTKNDRVTVGFGFKVTDVPGLSLNLDFANINKAGHPEANNTTVLFGINFAKPKLF